MLIVYSLSAFMCTCIPPFAMLLSKESDKSTCCMQFYIWIWQILFQSGWTQKKMLNGFMVMSASRWNKVWFTCPATLLWHNCKVTAWCVLHDSRVCFWVQVNMLITHTCISSRWPRLKNIQILCALLKGTEFFIVSYGLHLCGGNASKWGD